MKLKQILIALFATLLIASCTSEKDKYMNDWHKLMETVETNKKLTDDELKSAKAEYERLNSQFTKISEELSPEERQEVGKMEARYLKAYASQTANDFIKGLEGLIDVADGFIKEFTNGNGSDILKSENINRLKEKIDSSSLNKLVESVDNIQLEKIIDNIDTAQINNIVTGLAAMGASLTGKSLTEEEVNSLRKSIRKSDIEQLKNNITKEDIEALKQYVTADDIKKIKESLSPEEIKKLKDTFNSINK